MLIMMRPDATAQDIERVRMAEVRAVAATLGLDVARLD